VDPVCPLTTLDAAGREQLSGCAGDLKKRTLAQGQDTDFASAITQALATLGAAQDSAPKLIFMLTDGVLDVHNSPQYGTDAASRQTNGAAALTEELGDAAAQHVEIWPLGFGAQVDRDELAKIADDGYQGQAQCPDQGPAKPAMHVVSASSDVFAALLQAFAGARCGNDVLGGSATLGGDASTNLSVTIPPVASDGSIVVIKRNPAVVVTYFDPNGHQVPEQGSADGSGFEVSGQNSPVEALRITDPLPGTWRVHLVSPSGSGALQVMTAAVWQGALHSFITVSQPAPYASQQITVRIRLQTRSGVVLHTAAQLAGISVSATLTGTGFKALTILLRDDGQAPDTTANDGEFSGYVTIPRSAVGSLTLTGDVIGQGVVGDQRPTYLNILTSPPLLTATPALTTHQVEPGGSVTGTLIARNQDSKDHTVRFSVSGLDADARVSVSPASVTVPAAAQQQYSFTITFASGTPLGLQPGALDVTDATTGEPIYQLPLDVEVVAPQSWLSHWLWELVAAAVVLVLLIAGTVALLMRRREGLRFGPNLRLVLYHDEATVDDLRLNSQDSEMGFVLSGAGGTSPKLRKATAGKRFVLRRSGPGAGFEVRPPSGRPESLTTFHRVPLGEGFTVGLADGRPDEHRESFDSDFGTSPGHRAEPGSNSVASNSNITDF
jgi:hypothetical protein